MTIAQGPVSFVRLMKIRGRLSRSLSSSCPSPPYSSHACSARAANWGEVCQDRRQQLDLLLVQGRLDASTSEPRAQNIDSLAKALAGRRGQRHRPPPRAELELLDEFPRFRCIHRAPPLARDPARYATASVPLRAPLSVQPRARRGAGFMVVAMPQPCSPVIHSARDTGASLLLCSDGPFPLQASPSTCESRRRCTSSDAARP